MGAEPIPPGKQAAHNAALARYMAKVPLGELYRINRRDLENADRRA